MPFMPDELTLFKIYEDGSPGVTEPKTALRCSVLWTALTPSV